MKRTVSGFTIVELLIVIVVIAILAAISVVAYNGIQARANDATIQSDATTIAKKLEIAKVDIGHYPTTLAEMPEVDITESAYDKSWHNLYYCVGTAGDQYAVGLRSKSGNGFIISDGSISEAGAVNGNTTCEPVGTIWADATFRRLGYNSSSGAWAEPWH